MAQTTKADLQLLNKKLAEALKQATEDRDEQILSAQHVKTRADRAESRVERLSSDLITMKEAYQRLRGYALAMMDIGGVADISGDGDEAGCLQCGHGRVTAPKVPPNFPDEIFLHDGEENGELVRRAQRY